MIPEFYLLSLAHTQQVHRILTWWRANDSDYCFRLEWAGRYTQAQIDARRHYYDNGDRTRAVPCAVVDALAIRVGDVRDTNAIDPAENPMDHVVEYRHVIALRRKPLRPVLGGTRVWPAAAIALLTPVATTKEVGP